MLQHFEGNSQHRATNEEKDFLVKELMQIFKEFFPKIKRVDFAFTINGPEQMVIRAKGKSSCHTCYLLLNAMRKPYYQREAIANEIKTELGL